MINYFSQFDITFTGFEKGVQQQLAHYISEKRNLLKPIEIINDGHGERLELHIHYLNNVLPTDACNFKKSQSVSKYIICVRNCNDFENLLSYIQSGACACISALNIFNEIIPAIIAALKNKIYVSGEFASIADKYFKENFSNAQTDLFTDREHTLVQLLTRGALYKEIAWKLRISENTVRSHVRNIYSKMKVHSKTELTRKILNVALNLQFLLLPDYVAPLCY